MEHIAAAQPPIAHIIQNFIGSANFDLTSMDRSNRRLFAKSLRDFIGELQSHSSFASASVV